MKPRELANILIKILGLSVCLHAIPGFVSGFLRGLTSPTRASSAAANNWTYAVGWLVYLIVGILLLVQSRSVAGVLFKGEDE